jgi:hypothetical protein
MYVYTMVVHIFKGATNGLFGVFRRATEYSMGDPVK